MNLTRSLDEATALIEDGSSLYLGGAVLRRKPMAVVRAIAAAGRRHLDVITFAGSVDVDLLVASRCVRSVSSAYVGLGPAGSAPAFRKAVEDGSIDDREQSEWTLLTGLRAASMGVPFLPTRGGFGSQILEHLGFAETVDPYGTGRYLAVPALVPDVAVVHAWRGTIDGAIQLAHPPEHLWDVDVIAARAAGTTVVTVEEIVDAEVVAAEPHLTVLFGVDIDAVVEAPGGSWPTAGPPVHDEDHHTIADYAALGHASLLTGSPA